MHKNSGVIAKIYISMQILLAKIYNVGYMAVVLEILFLLNLVLTKMHA